MIKTLITLIALSVLAVMLVEKLRSEVIWMTDPPEMIWKQEVQAAIKPQEYICILGETFEFSDATMQDGKLVLYYDLAALEADYCGDLLAR